jgi:MFS family permease
VLFGLFGALVNPNAMSLMMHAYGPERRATAVGWFQFAVTGAPTIGLIVGGPLIDAYGWRVIFFSFAGVSLAAFLVGLPTLRPIPRVGGRPVDVPGAATLAVGVLAALLSITVFTSTIRDDGAAALLTSPQLFGFTLLAIVGLSLFVRVERTVEAPMLKLEYFGRRNFTMPLISSAAVQFAYMGGFVITPALLEDRYGWAVGSIALLMMPRPGVFSIASPLGGWLPARVGFRLPIVMGALAMMASMVAFALATPTTAGIGIAAVVVGLCLSGFAAGVSQPSIAALSVDSVDEADMGIANGMNQQMTFVGIVAGIQTMNVLIGDDASAGRFAATYMVGMIVAAIGLAAAFAVRDTREQGAGSDTRKRGK